ncbi:MAG TPA: PilZ domain-containing protein [Pyrinomonadaceae bacterium]|jgi:uncharacterized protein YlaN (UPF0358 family)|nr:PilZ domain-containing protein [Pyrinomonadaceae bacterium]
MEDRRQARRVDVNIPARWEGAKMQQQGTISSLSRNGCFLLTAGKVEAKELVRVELQIPDEEPLFFWGEVVDEAFEIGFAVRFNPIDDDEHRRLISFVERELAESK